MGGERDFAERIFELECRAAYQEETIDKLNDVVRDQWAVIDRLQKLVQELERRVFDVEERAPSAAPAQERPPHY